MDHMSLRATAVVSTILLSILTTGPQSAVAATIVDISQFPDGTPVPTDEIITDEYRDIGILFGGREGVNDNDPISLFIGGQSGNPASGRFLFNTPDVDGAVHEYDFVVPGTTTPTKATYFQIGPDFDGSESIEIVGLDQFGNEIASVTATQAGGTSPIVALDAPAGSPFSGVEVRTDGNPGIGFLGANPDALQFQLIPEPTSLALLGVGTGMGLARRRKRRCPASV